MITTPQWAGWGGGERARVISIKFFGKVTSSRHKLAKNFIINLYKLGNVFIK